MSESGARPLRIVLPGGSGQVGRMLARVFQERGHHVTVLTRGPYTASWPTVHWDGKTLGPWVETLEGADVCIHLSGRSINCRYTARNRRELYDSRIGPTRLLHRSLRLPRQSAAPVDERLHGDDLPALARQADGRGDRRDRRQRADLAPPPRSGEMELDGPAREGLGGCILFDGNAAHAQDCAAHLARLQPRAGQRLCSSLASGPRRARRHAGQWPPDAFPGCTRPIMPALSSF